MGHASTTGLFADCELLLANRDTLRGAAVLNWNATTTITTWDGITVGGAPMRVTQVDLNASGLTGTIPAALGGLDALTLLHLGSGSNVLTGSIPPELGNLSELTELRLNSNELSGPIPAALGNLSKLTVLSLSFNASGTSAGLSGPVPAALGNLGDLTTLYLNNNALTGSVPPELGGLASATRIRLENNGLTGCVPRVLADLAGLNLTSDLGDCPATPANLAAAAASGQVALSWDDPSESDITKYQVRVSDDGGGTWSPDWTDIAGSGASTTEHTVSSLANGTEYTFEVRAANADGDGAASRIAATPTGTPAERCANGTAVPDPTTNTELVADCAILLAERDTLRGAATLDWDEGSAVSGWDGVTVGGTPMRVTQVDLNASGLTGTIPAALGGLDALTLLHLGSGSNVLTGSIPPELGNLSELTELRLNSNELSGPIPAALGNLSKLTVLSLSFNASGTSAGLSGPVPAALGNLGDLTTLYLNNNALTGSVPPELGGLASATRIRLENNGLTGCVPRVLADLAGLNLTSDLGDCPATPANLAAAAASGQVALSWDDPSESDITKYQVRVSDDGGGTWSPDWTDIAGSGASTTEHTVSSLANGTEYTFEVRAANADGDGAASRIAATPTGTPAERCANGTAVPDPTTNTELVADCAILLAERDTLRGAATLDWDEGSAVSGWDGVTVGGAPMRVTQVDLNASGLTGTIPAALGGLDALTLLHLGSGSNVLTGSIPPELGNLSELTELRLNSNELSGPIPAALGNLSKLTVLSLSFNASGTSAGLSGPVPAALGNLGDLTTLYLNNNALTGSVPPELGGLASATRIRLENNGLTGCVPRVLADLAGLNLTSDLGDCPATPANLAAAAASGQVALSWDDPSESDITKYQVRVSDDGGGTWSPDWTDIAGSGASTTEHTVSSLANGTEYTFEVRAANADGDGAASRIAATPTGTPAERCANGTAVPDPTTNTELVADCAILLAERDTLRGAATLDWDEGSAVSGWDGVTVGGTPMRVTQVDLNASGLTGTIPAALGGLDALTLLHLGSGSNVLTGSIPPELGNLSELTELRLNSNELSGPIPAALGNLSKLTVLSLSFNASGTSAGLSGPVPAALGNLGDLTTLYLNNNALTGSVPPELGGLASATRIRLENNGLTGCVPRVLADLAGLNLTSDLGDCPATPANLAAAAASGQVALSWDDPSESDITKYQVRVSDDGGGTWSPDWTDIAGSGASTTEHTVSSLANGTEYTFEVRAANADGDGAASRIAATPTGTPAERCANGTAVPDPTTNTELVADCAILLAERDTLRGAATLDWDEGSAVSGWDGVTVGGTPMRVTQVDLNASGLTGTIPAALGGLDALTLLHLGSGSNVLTGSIPPELGNLSELTELRLNSNELSGPIPAALGNLSKLTVLSLSFNASGTSAGLSGPVPAALGNLGDLTTLYLNNNALTGSVPPELGGLASATRIRLENNGLTGCVPRVLADKTGLNLTSDLGDCPATPANLAAAAASGQVALSWDDPSESDITKYQVRVSDDGGGTWSPDWTDIAGSGASTTEHTVSSLANGTEYTFEVRAVNADGDGAASRIAATPMPMGPACTNGTVIPEHATNPALVADCEALLDLVDELRGAATLNWGAATALTAWDGIAVGDTPMRVQEVDLENRSPKLDGGVPAGLADLSTLITLDLSDNSLTGAVPAELAGVATLTTLDLANNSLTGCVPRVLADKTGLNLTSDLGDCPATPANLAAAAASGQVALSWDDPSESDITKYQVRVSDDGGGTWSPDWTDIAGSGASTTEHTVSSLANGTEYTFEVRAANADGDGAASRIAATPTGTPAERCANGTAVPDPTTNTELVADCAILLAERDTLRGAATLDWDEGSAVSGWDGVTVGGTPMRVTQVDLNASGLTGTIPAALGGLDALTLLHLGSGSNVLTGSIPPELGNLSELTELRLNSNELSGPIPAALGNLSKLTVLSLSFNASGTSAGLSGPVPAALGNLGDLTTLYLNNNALTGSVPPELGGLASATRIRLENNGLTGCVPRVLADLAGLNLTSDLGDCPATPANLAAAAASGQVALSWDDPSESDITKYQVRVSDDGGGTWSPDWTDIAGSGASTTEHTVSSLANGTEYTFEVRAANADGDGAASRIAATPMPMGPACTNGTVIPEHATNPALVADCEALLDLVDELRGAATLNWGAATALTAWDGIAVGDTPMRVQEVDLENRSPKLDGGVPAGLADLSTLITLDLSDNSLTGAVPAELAGVATLTTLDLANNSLTGCVPRVLADKTGLNLTSDLGDCPATPANLAAAAASGQVALSWDDPSESDITKYQVRVSDDGGGTWSPDWTDIAGSGASTTEHTVSSLANGTEYTFEVRAANADGDGAASRIAATPMPMGPACTNGTVIPEHATNPALVADCEALLDLVDELRGAATLNWGAATALTAWDGIAVGDTPMRVQEVDLENRSPKLDGGVPAGLADLSTLITLDLSDNSLTGAVPAELAGVATLTTLDLANNSLTGCVPRVLADKTGLNLTSDLGDCPATPANLAAAAASGQVALSWDDPSESDITKYQVRVSDDGGGTWSPDWTDIAGSGASTTEHTVSSLANGTEYTFEVRAANADGDGAASRIAATPTGTPAERCANGTAVPDPTTNTELVADCAILLAERDTLRGAATLDWDEGSAVSGWDGVTVGGTPMRVTQVDLNASGLTGTIPAALGGLDALTLLHLGSGSNVLTGSIPPELGNLSELTELRLNSNELSGPIPAALGNLSKLTVLSLSFNASGTSAGLSGPVPAALGNLGDLTTLYLNNNALTGSVPPELGGLASATRIRLENNGLTGCVPRVLADLAGLNLTSDLGDCPATPANLAAAAASGQVALSWDDPSESDITKYQVRVSDDGGGTWSPDWTDIAGSGASTTEHTVSSLANGTEYTFEVRAANADGDGAASRIAATPTGTPAERCANGTAVPDPTTNTELVADCAILLAERDTLRGAATLDWDEGSAVSGWDGVTVGGTPMRVTQVDLNASGLTGTIPAALGGLDALTLLHLGSGSNVLTGSIPPELGNLSELTELRLNSNELSGPIPAALGNLSKLTVLSLSFNASGTSAGLSGPVPAALGNLGDLTTLYLNSNSLTGSVPPELGGLASATRIRLENNGLTGCVPRVLADLAGLNLTSDLGDCPATPANLAAAAASGQVALSWDDPSESDITKYQVRVSDDGGGTWSPDWTDIAGSGASTTEHTVSSLANGTEYTFEVRAANADGDGGAARVAATPDRPPAERCANGTAVPDPTTNTELVADCAILLAARDTLRGTVILNWNASTAITTWEGITVGGAPTRVQELDLNDSGIAGTIPAALSGLDALTILHLGSGTNAMTGPIPPELGDLSELTELRLNSNELSGPIPPELGNLSKLTVLSLSFNDRGTSAGLSGSIPAALGNLGDLTTLYLNNNALTGSVPAALGGLASATRIRLESNSLTGCVPRVLADIAGLNLTSDLTDCPATPANLAAAAGSGQVTLSWDDPSESDITKYQVRVSGDGGGTWSPDWTDIAGSGASTTEHTVSSLANGTEYTFEVRAVNAVGDGAAARVAATPDRPPAERCANGTAVPDPTTNTELVADCAILLAARDTMRGTATLDWDEGSAVSGWQGVTVGGAPTRVQELDLNDSGIAGTIPAALSGLDALTILHLGSGTNAMTGPIPPELGDLSELTELRLNSNELSGPIPAALGNLSKLTVLSLSFNDSGTSAGLSGPIPAALGNLGDLTTLYLNNNALTGSVPAALGGLASATRIRLESNSLTGCVPRVLADIAGLNLTSDLTDCPATPTNFATVAGSGQVALSWDDPSESDITKYQYRVSDDGGATWSPNWTDVPGSDATTTEYTVTGLTNDTEYTFEVRAVGAVGNGAAAQTTATPRRPPAERCANGIAVPDPTSNTDLVADCAVLLGARDQLQGTADLDWSDDTTVSGWQGVTVGGTPMRVQEVDLDSVGLTGTIPGSLGDLAALTVLNLGRNDLTGSIPAELGDLAALTLLRLNSNDLTGSIPTELGQLSHLEVLSLAFNGSTTDDAKVGLTGSIPTELGNLGSLTFLSLSTNSLSGTIPVEFGDLADLEELYLRSNDLTGSIPVGLGDLANLTALYLHDNQLSGAIPGELGQLSDLEELILRDNQLTGEVPLQLGDLLNLTALNLENNNLTGCMPRVLADNTGLSLTSDLVNCPAAPTNLAAFPGSGEAALTWDDPSDADITKYQYRASDDGGATWSPDWTDMPGSDATTTIHTVSGLTNDTEYTFAVRAVNAAGGGAAALVAGTPRPVNTVCINGTVVPDRATNPGLVADCGVLLGLRDDLRGTATVNWGASTAIASWDGITVGGTPMRVQEVNLENRSPSLDGTVPAALGSLPSLTTLDLSDNSLTGSVPIELSDLSALTTLDLANNDLSGCMPQALFEKADLTVTSDLSNCPTTPPNLGVTPGSGAVDLIWDDPSDTSITGYQYRVSTDGGATWSPDWTDVPGSGSTTTTHTVSGLTNDTQYTIEVRAASDAGVSVPARIVVTPMRSARERCGNGTAVPSPATNAELVEDCAVLLGGLDQLRGTATLDWIEDAGVSGWTGVTVGGTPARVQQIDLENSGLTGTIPTTLGELGALTVLNLDRNDLTGSIPAALANLAALTELRLDSNRLTGSIPSELGDLSELRILSLAFNGTTDGTRIGLTGSIPTELGQLTNLTLLSLSANGLSGTVPAQLGSLSNLQELYLRNNDLTGTIPPVLGGMASLERLYLSDNDLSGGIPSALGGLSNLTRLWLVGNQLSGAIPAALGGLDNLQQLTLNDNLLTGEVPPALGDLPALTILRLQNNALTGCLPYALAARVAGGNLEVTTDLSNCPATPRNFAVATGTGQITLTWDDPGDASITQYQYRLSTDGGTTWSAWSPIPGSGASTTSHTVTGLTDGTHTVELRAVNSAGDGVAVRATPARDLCSNGTAVTDPTTNAELVADCAVLLDLRDALRGSEALNWSEIGNVTDWSGITVGGTPLRVQEIDLDNLGLTGVIPAAMSELSALTVLHLGRNDLTGSIPTTLGDLTALVELRLNTNELTGSIPTALGRLANLEYLSLAFNGTTDGSRAGLTGPIPAVLGNLSNLRFLNLSANSLNGAIPATLGNLSNLEELFLRDNHLTGEVPAALGSIASLQRLWLHNNSLSGCMPVVLAGRSDLDLQSDLSECPATPPNLVATTGSGQLTLSWDDPGDAGITGYQYRLSTDGGVTWSPDWTDIADSDASTTRHTVQGVADDDYTVEVRAVSAAGNGAAARATTSPSIPARELCANGTAVPDPTTNTALLDDCAILLHSRDALRGAAELDWSEDAAIEDWTGVAVGGTPLRVLSVELGDSGLAGIVPARLAGLSALQVLNLGGGSNSLTGTIPAELGNLINLTELHLNANALTGPIPHVLGQLVDLETLSLEFNDLDGEIPTAITNLAELRHLFLGANELTGPIPSALGELANLETFSLFGNNLDDVIPDTLGSLSNLVDLRLDSNILSGQIPTTLGNLSNLERLNLRDNALTGEVPLALAVLANLMQLLLENNDLAGCMPWALAAKADLELSSDLANCPATPSNLAVSLESGTLTLTWNDPGDDSITTYQYRLSTDGGTTWTPDWTDIPGSDATTTSHSVQGQGNNVDYTVEIRTVNNAGQGVPARASTMYVTAMDRCANGTAVPDPATNTELVADCAILLSTRDTLQGAADLDWSENTPVADWTGVAVGDTPLRVQRVELPDSGLTGTIPVELGSLSALTVLNLGGGSNALTGTIPAELGNLTALTELRLNSNSLAGPIPAALGRLADLRILSLALNDLSGGIPDALADLAELRHLYLESNNLTGMTPTGLGRLAKLETLSLFGNELGGAIPAALGGLSNLVELVLSSNQLTGEIPAELGNLANLAELSLRNNQLTGEVPAELGMLANLLRLRLENNNLTGCMPWELANNASLELTSDLGNCPATLGNLAVSRNDGEATLTWDDPDDPGITTYQYRSSTDAGSNWSPDWTDIAGSGASTTTHTVAELDDDLEYLFELRAVNAAGVGIAARVEAPLPLTLADVCARAVSDADDNPALAADCEVLLSARDELLGDVRLNWNAKTAIADWDGVATGGSPARIQELELGARGLTGGVAAGLARLTGLNVLNLSRNDLAGPIPGDLGALANLVQMHLDGNDLTGPIPAELGNLVRLETLSLADNGLTGSIPAALGGLSLLEALDLSNNALAGDVPESLGDLGNLVRLGLEHNELSGCLPRSLADNPALTVTTDLTNCPAMPRNLTAETRPGEVTLTWDGPGEANIATYQYRVSDDDGATWSPDWTDIPGSGPSTVGHELTGLDSGILYTFEIRAVSDAGAGAAARVSVQPGPHKVSFGSASYEIRENGDPVTVAVVLTPRANADVSIPIAVSPATDSLQGIPAEIVFAAGESRRTFAVTATEEDDDAEDQTVWLAFGALPDAVIRDVPTTAALMVIDDDKAAQARIRSLNRSILSRQALAIVDDANLMIESRLNTMSTPATPAPSLQYNGGSELAGVLRSSARELAQGGFEPSRMVGGISFALPLVGTGGWPGMDLSIWGSGSYDNLSGRDLELDWDGSLVGFQVGADMLPRPNLLTGLSLSRSVGSFDYREGTDTGRYTSEITSLHPYAGWSLEGRTAIWTSIGFGRGKIEIEEAGRTTQSSDTDFAALTVGASGELRSWGGAADSTTGGLRLKGEALLARTGVDRNGLVPEMTIDASRLRMMLEGSARRPLPEGRSLSTLAEFGLRYDGSHADTGTAVELGAGVQLLDPARGLVIEGRGRVLWTADDFSEWGTNLSIRLGPSANGQGLSLRLEPSYGVATSGIAQLWSRGFPVGTGHRSGAQEQVGAEIGYGLQRFGGVLKPYAGVAVASRGRHYRAGATLVIGSSFEMELQGETRSGVPPGVALTLSWCPGQTTGRCLPAVFTRAPGSRDYLWGASESRPPSAPLELPTMP